MPGFRSEQVAFEAPDNWEDKTIVAFAAPATPGKFSPNIVMTKEPLKQGETLRNYADRQIMELARRLDGFDLIDSGDRTLGNLPALEYKFAWRSEHAELHQRTVLTAVVDTVFTFTGTATHADEAPLDEAMDQLLATVRFQAPAPYNPAGSSGGGYPPPSGGGWAPSKGRS
jgi:hypothetical protein